MWDKLMGVMNTTGFMVSMVVALIVLIGLYLFLKNNRKDED